MMRPLTYSDEIEEAIGCCHCFSIGQIRSVSSYSGRTCEYCNGEGVEPIPFGEFQRPS